MTDQKQGVCLIGLSLPQDLVLSNNLNKQKPRPPPALMSMLTIKIKSHT